MRLVQGQDPQTIVLDSHLRYRSKPACSKTRDHPWIACLEDANPIKSAELESHGALVLRIPADNAGCVSVPALLERLASFEINSLMVEGVPE